MSSYVYIKEKISISTRIKLYVILLFSVCVAWLAFWFKEKTSILARIKICAILLFSAWVAWLAFWYFGFLGFSFAVLPFRVLMFIWVFICLVLFLEYIFDL